MSIGGWRKKVRSILTLSALVTGCVCGTLERSAWAHVLQSNAITLPSLAKLHHRTSVRRHAVRHHKWVRQSQNSFEDSDDSSAKDTIVPCRSSQDRLSVTLAMANLQPRLCMPEDGLGHGVGP